jgi:hypothetical protein
MQCKQCKNEIQLSLSGLRKFCSEKCKKAYRKAYMANLMHSKRAVSIRGGYLSMDSQNVSNTNPYQKPICKAQNGSLGLSEDNFDGFGGKEGYLLSKKLCCNFEVKEKEGYCLSLTEPYNTFRTKCIDCMLLKALQQKQKLYNH